MTTRREAINPSKMIIQHLRDINGSAELAVDGSSTPVEFFFAPLVGDRAFIRTVKIEIVAAAFDDVAVFAGGSALTNGIGILVKDRDGNILLDVLNGDPIAKDADWSDLAGENVIPTKNTGDDLYAVTWDITDTGIDLFLDELASLRFVIQDDLSGLTQMHVVAHGLLESNV